MLLVPIIYIYMGVFILELAPLKWEESDPSHFRGKVNTSPPLIKFNDVD